ncbi:MAG: putative bifunctional diguanylate cyclase/phosphodiesterase [Vibrio sp.]
MLTKYTHLSAWALTQLEVETLDFVHRVDTYLIDESPENHQAMRVYYDILWNRFDVFLTSKETEELRQKHNAEPVIQATFVQLKHYEAAINNQDKSALKELRQALEPYSDQIRDLTIINFTGESVNSNLRMLAHNKQQFFYFFVAILIILLLLSYLTYRSADYQQFLAWHDPLTRLKNRNFISNTLQKSPLNRQEPVTMILFDINRFKELNNTMGYTFGDQLLIKIAGLLTQRCQSFGYQCARIGADEFAVLLYPCNGNAEFFIRNLWNDLSKLVREHDKTKRLSIAMGVVTCQTQDVHQTDSALRASSLLNNADVALNIAKKMPNGHVVYYTRQIENAYNKKRILAGQLQTLLNDPQQTSLHLCYQPILSRSINRLGCEALLRWQHIEWGDIEPQYLVEVAEEYGLGKKLGTWIMTQVYLALKNDWKDFHHQLEISINLSNSLFDESLPRLMAEAFDHQEKFLNSIILELTETMTINDFARSLAIINRLEKIKVRFALDDFGTGWSSLYQLNHLKFSKLKIDKSFVDNMNQNTQQAIFITSIVNLSHQLGMQVVAEGVEQRAQLEQLKQLGVDEFQGYYFSHPIKKSEFSAFCKHYFAAETTPLSNLMNK